MSGALRRSPSPQQIFDGASRTVVAGVAAAGAAVGSALSSIREEDKNAYKDHRTWQEEAEARAKAGNTAAEREIEMRLGGEPGVASTRVQQSNGKRKTVAIVVSADASLDFDEDESSFHEHAVRLSLFIVLLFTCANNASPSYLTYLATQTSQKFDSLSLFMPQDLKNTPWTQPRPNRSL
jgi:hypothetical protein